MTSAASMYGIYRFSQDEAPDSAAISESIAQAQDVKNEVKRKPVGSFSWYSVSDHDGLAYKDMVFVGPGGFTNLVLKDGSKLTLRENSLIVLDTKTHAGADKKSSVVEINLVRGDVAIQKAENTADLRLVVGKGAAVGVKSGTSLAVGKSAKGINLVVKKGQIKLSRKTAKKTEEVDLKPASPIRIKNLSLTDEDTDLSKELSAKEDIHPSEIDSKKLESLLDLVPDDPAEDRAPLEAQGKLENFSKDVEIKNTTEMAAVPPAQTEPAPPAAEPPPQPAPPPEPPKPKANPFKVLDITLRGISVAVDIPPEVRHARDLSVEMSFNKTFRTRVVKIPVDIAKNEKTFNIDMSYLLEIPGFKKQVTKHERLFYRLTAVGHRDLPVRGVELNTSRAKTSLRLPASLDYTAQSGEALLPLKWNFQGVFVDRFYVTLAEDADFKNVICRVSVLNQDFVDPAVPDENGNELKAFSYDLRSSKVCDFAPYANKKEKLHVRVEPVDPDGNVVKIEGGPMESVALAREDINSTH
jgi:hypothetical protein